MSAGPANRPHGRPIAPDARALHRRLHSAVVPAWEPQASDEHDARRRELYVVLAVCLEEVVGDFVAAVPADRLPRLSEPGIEATAAFCDLLLRTFDGFFDRQADVWRRPDQSGPIAPLLHRVDVIGPGGSAVLDRPRPRYAETLMRAGMSTMAAVAPPVLSAATRLAGADGVEAVAELARSSVRVPARLAALGLDEFSGLQRALIDPETMEFRHTDAVRLVQGSRPRLELSELPDGASAQGAWSTQAPGAARFGCPTLVRLGSSSAMERLWAWTVDAARANGYFAQRLGGDRAV